ncbi:hypothetical protein [Polyangium mundeleinium]|uniref:CN hydrolase domain-containing protein n=1 Tax=Polyangium mundeleinium TaxID=2995306 RepID=A0ABT5EWB4_9BACT|nr:hypothetical protein [Polyangium mundeleinium]MDC0746108.1 hypothetical protein [Polyangium mundeleinium]
MAASAETVLPPRARAALVGALVGASGSVWIALSAPPHAFALVLLLAITVRGSAFVAAKLPSWRPTLALGLALCALLLGPVLFFVVREGLSETKLVEDVCSFWLSFDLRAASFYPLVGLLPLAIGGAVTFPLARFLTERAPFLAPLLRAGSLAAVACTFAVLVWATPRMLRGFDPGRYVESLPVIGVVPPVEGSPLRILEAKELAPGPEFCSLEQNPGYTTRVQEVPLPRSLVAQRYCPSFRRDCSLLINPAGSTSDDKYFLRPVILTGSNMWDCDPRRVDVARNGAFLVREDAPRGLLLFDGTVRYALDRSTRTFKSLHVSDIRDATSSPPYGWSATAVAGLLVAAFLERLRFRARGRLRRIATAPAGVLGADGWLVVGDAASPLRAEIHAGLPPGPVIVLSREGSAASKDPYRGDALPADLEILPGERAEVLARERWVSVSPIDAVTLAVLVVASTPLVAFWHG